ncbi:MAG: adenylyltransferase/cytidyltransferase family protein [Patescibacteria group bacterium]|nr:adenylyltransferase/cytidyltransferase family protein [Patescibacteria group bacterium]
MKSKKYKQKIRKRFSLKKILDLEKKKGKKKIVFTNGVFDIFHVGHLHYLQESKKLGDILIVGINSDKSTKRFKGPKRPLVNQNERVEIIAALDCVDFAFVFNETTAERSIKFLKPDIYTKGGDHKIENIIEAPLVFSYGGEVKVIPATESRSVTLFIEKILNEIPLKLDQSLEYAKLKLRSKHENRTTKKAR